VICSFGCGGEESTKDQSESNNSSAESSILQENKAGLEYLMSMHFVERACAFMLGNKSPLCTPGEKRIEMGGSFSSPNFSAIIKLLTKILTDPELLEKYPLNESEKKMFLHADLLKVMLSSQVAIKQFGQCLANMCKDNLKMS